MLPRRVLLIEIEPVFCVFGLKPEQTSVPVAFRLERLQTKVFVPFQTLNRNISEGDALLPAQMRRFPEDYTVAVAAAGGSRGLEYTGPETGVQTQIRRKTSTEGSGQRAMRPRSPLLSQLLPEEPGGEKRRRSPQISAQSNYKCGGGGHGGGAHLLSSILLEMSLNH